MKKLMSVLLVLFLAVSVSACGSSSTSTKKTELLIAISPDYPPYESLTSSNKMVGFDVDMTKELISIMNKNGGNYSYKFKQMSFDSISNSIITGQVDLGISGFTKHSDWNVEWSHKYNTSKQVALIAKDSKIATKADLQGKKVGAQLGATGADVAKSIKNAKVTTVKDAKILVETLKSGGLDAVILDYAVAENYVKSSNLKIMNETLKEEENLIIAKKGDTKIMTPLNKALDEFVKSKKYTTLKEKWGC